jgi:hypothetical protein
VGLNSMLCASAIAPAPPAARDTSVNVVIAVTKGAPDRAQARWLEVNRRFPHHRLESNLAK